MAARQHTVWIGVAVAAAAGGVAWVLYGSMPERSDPSRTVAASAPVNLPGAAPGPVGVSAAPSAPVGVPMAAADRFKLVGVMLSGNVRIALITVDSKPTQMFRVGETVDGKLVVREVSERGVSLGPRDGGAAMALELSQPAPSVTVAAPVPTAQAAQAAPVDPLAGRAVQSQDSTRKSGSKYLPLAPQAVAAPLKPGDAPVAPVAPVDDGRWKPSGQQ